MTQTLKYLSQVTIIDILMIFFELKNLNDFFQKICLLRNVSLHSRLLFFDIVND